MGICDIKTVWLRRLCLIAALPLIICLGLVATIFRAGMEFFTELPHALLWAWKRNPDW